MKKKLWLTYDLGVGGDYQNLYGWLDDHGAVECGNNFAFLTFESRTAQNDEELMKEMIADIRHRVNLKAGNRIYVVRSFNEDGKTATKGSFIFGRRMASPWEGYGSTSDDKDEEG